MDLVSQKYWDDSYRNFAYHVANDELTRWIDKQHELFTPKGDMFEFGCFPGRYMAHLGKKGWRVNGIDLTPGMGEAFRAWLQSEGINTGLLQQADALAYAATSIDRYDLVCSFGFIEHFEDFLNLVVLHDRLLKSGGWLMITTPNFRGPVQKFLHQRFNRESLKIHYLPSMQPNLWKRKLEQLGYRIFFAGHFGGFDFWYDEEERKGWQNLALKFIRKIKPALKKLPDHGAYSPYCGIVAQKIER